MQRNNPTTGGSRVDSALSFIKEHQIKIEDWIPDRDYLPFVSEDEINKYQLTIDYGLSEDEAEQVLELCDKDEIDDPHLLAAFIRYYDRMFRFPSQEINNNLVQIFSGNSKLVRELMLDDRDYPGIFTAFTNQSIYSLALLRGDMEMLYALTSVGVTYIEMSQLAYYHLIKQKQLAESENRTKDASFLSTLIGDSFINRSQSFYSILFNAIRIKDIEIAKIVFNEAKRSNSFNEVEDCLLFAAEEGCYELCEYYLSQHVDVNHQQSMNHDTALFLAVEADELKICELLLSANANPDLVNECQWTPLMNAAQNSNVEIVRLLINHNANVNFQNDSGYTALHLAVEIESIEVVKLLVATADLSLKNQMNLTPLELAKQIGNEEIIKLLTATSVQEKDMVKAADTSVVKATRRLGVIAGHLSLIDFSLWQQNTLQARPAQPRMDTPLLSTNSQDNSRDDFDPATQLLLMPQPRTESNTYMDRVYNQFVDQEPQPTIASTSQNSVSLFNEAARIERARQMHSGIQAIGNVLNRGKNLP